MAKIKFHTGDPRRDRILGEIAEMKYKDLQAAVIKRGMPFDEVVNGTFPSLSSWLEHHWDNSQDKALLQDFDRQMDKTLKERGYKKSNPVRQFKRFEPEYSQEEQKKLNPPKPKKIKPLKEKKKKSDKYGIFEGTKKEYTYRLSEKVYADFYPKYRDTKTLVKKFKDQLCAKVKKKFPEANDKSVTIWMKRCLDSINESKTKEAKA